MRLLLVVSLSSLALFPLRLTSLGLPLGSLSFLSVPYPKSCRGVRICCPNDRLRVISCYVALLATLPALFLFLQALLLEGSVSHRNPGLTQSNRNLILAVLESAGPLSELPASLPEFAFPFRLPVRLLRAFKLKLIWLRVALL